MLAFGCLYLERNCFSYFFSSSCFAVRFALTYCWRDNVPMSVSCFKLDDLVDFAFGCLYLERNCFSYFFISSCFALRFALTYCRRVSLPTSAADFRLDDLTALLLRFASFLALFIFLVFPAVFLVFEIS